MEGRKKRRKNFKNLFTSSGSMNHSKKCDRRLPSVVFEKPESALGKLLYFLVCALDRIL